MSHLRSAGINPEPWVTGTRRIPWNVLQQQLARGLNCIPTSSMGRLFDAVAAVLHIREDVSYEAQAAVEMETLCRGVEPEIVYSFDVSNGSPAIIDPTPMWHQLVADMRNGVSQSQLAARFHASIVATVRDVAVRLRQDTGVHAVGLSGGSFQNLTLLGGSQSLLESAGFRVCTHSLVPPNDGGIALGQASLARR
jgi:hydrogenase maturation protein HypF